MLQHHQIKSNGRSRQEEAIRQRSRRDNGGPLPKRRNQWLVEKEPSASNYVSTEKWEKMAERCFIRAPNGRISQHPDSPGDSSVFTPEGVNHRPRGRSHRPEVHAHSPLQLPLIPQLCGSADFRRMNGKGRHSSFTSKRDLRGPETFPHLSPLFSYWSHGDRNT